MGSHSQKPRLFSFFILILLISAGAPWDLKILFGCSLAASSKDKRAPRPDAEQILDMLVTLKTNEPSTAIFLTRVRQLEEKGRIKVQFESKDSVLTLQIKGPSGLVRELLKDRAVASATPSDWLPQEPPPGFSTRVLKSLGFDPPEDSVSPEELEDLLGRCNTELLGAGAKSAQNKKN